MKKSARNLLVAIGILAFVTAFSSCGTGKQGCPTFSISISK